MLTILLESVDLISRNPQTSQTKYTFGPVDIHPHHEITIRSGVTRNIAGKFDEIRDEVVNGFDDHIPLTEGCFQSTLSSRSY